MVFVASLLSLALAAAPAAAAPRIIGGEKVPQSTLEAQYSAVVSVRSSNVIWGARSGRRFPDAVTHVCGGTVIAPRLVLTAAHCVTTLMPLQSGPGLTVLARTATLSTRTGTAGTRVTAVYVHPQFNGNRSDFSFLFGPNQSNPRYDVAVLRLAEPIDGVTPMPLVDAADDASTWGAGAGRPSGATALGWGITRAPGHRSTRSSTLHAVALAIRADRRCERSDGGLGNDATHFDSATMLCAGTADGPGPGTARATCFGDSGGPLLAPRADGSLRLVGVSSWTSTRMPCTGWSAFARIAGLRDWIASIPADEGGAGGLLAPRDVTGASAADSGLAVSWTASPSGDVARYRVLRAATFPRRFLGPFAPTFLLEAAATDADARRIVLEGVEPQRRGQSETRLVRVDVEDSAGNRVAGRVTRVPAPIDATAPTPPSTPAFLDRRGRRGESLLVRAATDADCVAGYGVQVRTAGGWRGLGTWVNQACDPIFASSPFGFGFGWGSSMQSTRRIVLPLRKLDAGRHRVRVIAIDRAGNTSASRATVISLDEQVRGVRPGSCLNGAYSYCAPIRARAGSARGVTVVVS